MTPLKNTWTRIAATLAAATVISTSIALADDDEDDEFLSSAKIAKLRPANPKWTEECGACHLAYPPRFLPPESWRQLMAGLDKHFGSDASLDAETAQEITAFLVEHARRKDKKKSTHNAPLRISETRWFKHEHDDIPPRGWKDPKVKSPANCQACHTMADSGDYSEHNIRIPR